MKETIHARGHEHVRAEHGSTVEVTTDDWLTPAGDCILGVEADRAPADFDPEFVSACRDGDARITTIFEADRYEEIVTGRGHPDLTFGSERGMVGRTSEYIDDRTFTIGTDKAAADFDRDLVGVLAEGADLTVTIRVE